MTGVPVPTQMKLQALLGQMQDCFKKGMKVCFTARMPDNPEADLWMGDDTFEGVHQLLQRRARAALRLPPIDTEKLAQDNEKLRAALSSFIGSDKLDVLEAIRAKILSNTENEFEEDAILSVRAIQALIETHPESINEPKTVG